MKKLFCYLWKHRIIYNDSGCDVCGRCGKHEYYDRDFHDGKPLFRIKRFLESNTYRLNQWYKTKILKQKPF